MKKNIIILTSLFLIIICIFLIIKKIDNTTKTLDLHPLVSNLTWNDFVNSRNELLHVISENEFISHD